MGGLGFGVGLGDHLTLDFSERYPFCVNFQVFGYCLSQTQIDFLFPGFDFADIGAAEARQFTKPSEG